MTMSLKILTLGAGAIGTYIGGSLALAGHQLIFIEQPKVVEELRERGLRLDLTIDPRRKTKEAFVIGPRSFVIVPSLEEALNYGPFDIALYALKSFDTPMALEGMRPCADRIPPILCLSNGVDNEPAIARELGADKAIGRRAAGDIVLEKLRGLGIGAGHILSENLVSTFNDAYLNCRLYPDPHSMKWSKLLTNLVANPTSAILDMTAAEIFAGPV
jgi:2-dehydropantoate 2-reductase